ncbi:hypothetical protein CHH91_12610 [Virgibacillus sp. 7505]|uniref:hypothetical protein n=1 Tax=Virgibacillus sp. 7505 TaxID=2022548 RepID=UPI000BA691D5|nr:hypothetical protein [Virgibacillus sp. 7505]PAE15795.1 hypothetical protein CHH91_12610 [Virgibacillus sp. 7505]
MKQHYLYLNGLQLAYLDNGIFTADTSIRCLTILNKYRMKTTSYTTQRALMEQKTAAGHVSPRVLKRRRIMENAIIQKPIEKSHVNITYARPHSPILSKEVWRERKQLRTEAETGQFDTCGHSTHFEDLDSFQKWEA